MLSYSKIISSISGKTVWPALIIMGICIRIVMLPVETGDFVVFLKPWIDFIKANGYFSALQFDFYNYAPSYIYILVFIAKTGLNPLFMVKLVSIAFEYITAMYIGRIAFLQSGDKRLIRVALGIIPLIPTVILNSSYLSQCDSIYTAFAIGSLYFILKKKKLMSVLFLGISFAFKMQAAVLLPFFFVTMLKGKIQWYYFLTIPAIYLASILPAWIFGRPMADLLGTYIAQADHYRQLTMNFPNLYIWISNNHYEAAKTVGIFFTIFTTLAAGFYLGRRVVILSSESLIRFVFLGAIIVPFLLPGMHERYMYVGDVLAILYALVIRKNLHLPAGIIIVSSYSYIRCSRFNDILPMEPAFFVYLCVIIMVMRDFTKSLKNDSNSAGQ